MDTRIPTSRQASGGGPPPKPTRPGTTSTSRLDPDERLVIKTLIDAILLKHEAKNWAAS